MITDPTEPSHPRYGTDNDQGGDWTRPHRSVHARRPTTVNAAFWLLVATPIIHLASSGVGYLSFMRILSRLPAPSRARLHENSTTLNLSFLAGIAIVLIVTALWLVVIIYIRRARQWARITITALGSFDLGIIALATFALVVRRNGVPLAGPALAIDIAEASTILIAIVLLFTSSANAYFRATHERGA